MSGDRQLSEQKLRSEYRQKVRRRDVAMTKAAALYAEADDLLADLLAQVGRESERFGVEVPCDGLILDILELVEVEPDGTWSWSGGTNNKGLPTVRWRPDTRSASERGVTRVLAEAFGLIDPDWEGLLYPLRGTQNVNPWHREMRAFPPGKVRGNANRYGFKP